MAASPSQPSPSGSSASSSTLSSTSLARFAVAKAPDMDPFNGSASRDFCNSFWGEGDAGVHILLARMKGAVKTTDDVRKFWQERAVIEDEYATRLLELAKIRLGRDEIGDLRNALDTLLLETAKHGTTHQSLSTQIRAHLEAPTTELLKRQISHRKRLGSPLEKRFAEKQEKERVLANAKEKYVGDCLRVSAYTQKQQQQQQTPLSPNAVPLTPRAGPGLRRAQLAVQVAEKAISDLTAALQEDCGARWEKDWREFCDASQDLEEERIEVMKDVMWGYANAVSGVCVSDDQACERLRIALDQLDPALDVLGFVEDYGSGNTLPVVPVFIPFEEHRNRTPLTPPRRHARFARASTRRGENAPPQTPTPTPTPSPSKSTSSPKSNAANGNGKTPPPFVPGHRRTGTGRGSRTLTHTRSERRVKVQEVVIEDAEMRMQAEICVQTETDMSTKTSAVVRVMELKDVGVGVGAGLNTRQVRTRPCQKFPGSVI